MTLRRLILILTLLSSFVAAEAHAGVLVEPMVGYQFGDGDEGSTDHTYSGPFLGGRLGYQTLGLMLGLDYRLATFEDKAENTAGVTKDDQKQQKIGAFVGYNLPIMLRAWASYYFDVSTEDDDSRNANKGDKYSGDGIGLGIGFTGLPFISLNLEYHSFSYDEFENASTGSKSSVSDFDASEILFSVSLPLDF